MNQTINIISLRAEIRPIYQLNFDSTTININFIWSFVSKLEETDVGREGLNFKKIIYNCKAIIN